LHHPSPQVSKKCPFFVIIREGLYDADILPLALSSEAAKLSHSLEYFI